MRMGPGGCLRSCWVRCDLSAVLELIRAMLVLFVACGAYDGRLGRSKGFRGYSTQVDARLYRTFLYSLTLIYDPRHARPPAFIWLWRPDSGQRRTNAPRMILPQSAARPLVAGVYGAADPHRPEQSIRSLPIGLLRWR
jgi:hypothetical protein